MSRQMEPNELIKEWEKLLRMYPTLEVSISIPHGLLIWDSSDGTYPTAGRIHFKNNSDVKRRLIECPLKIRLEIFQFIDILANAVKEEANDVVKKMMEYVKQLDEFQIQQKIKEINNE